MKKKIKLKDITLKQYMKWLSKCDGNCEKCLLHDVHCGKKSTQCRITKKDIYSGKFLNQEIEIEVRDKDETLLTLKEKEYLEGVIRPFKDEISCITKSYDLNRPFESIIIQMESGQLVQLPEFKPNKYYKGLKLYDTYTLEQLGLFEERKYKITLTEFWNSKDKLAIHCNNEEKAYKLLKAFNKLGKKWCDGDLYLNTLYKRYKEKTCYDNGNKFADFDHFVGIGYTIYEFEDVDLEN